MNLLRIVFLSLLILKLTQVKGQFFAIAAENSFLVSHNAELLVSQNHVLPRNSHLILRDKGYLLLMDEKWNIFEYVGPKAIRLDSLRGHSLFATIRPDTNFFHSVIPRRQTVMDPSRCESLVYNIFPYSTSFQIKDLDSLYFFYQAYNSEVKIYNEDQKLIESVSFSKDTVAVLVLKKLANSEELLISYSKKCIPLSSKQLLTFSFKRIHSLNDQMNHPANMFVLGLYFEQAGYHSLSKRYYEISSIHNDLATPLKSLVDLGLERLKKKNK